MEQSKILLIKLSANLPSDIKKFIGTILVSELLHAVRNRHKNRNQFCIFIDEFQHFATEQFAELITEGRKFGVATTVAHQERYGQFGENQKILGATAACANKVFFQLTVRDAQELAPEFADKPQATERRREADLIFSPHPVEDILDRGHPEEHVMHARSRYFWIVNLLRTRSHEKYFEFSPQLPHVAGTETVAAKLHWNELSDWGFYRSTPDMVTQGISALNLFLYECMTGKRNIHNITPEDIMLVYNVVDSLGGVLGFRPLMIPYIPDEKRDLLLRAIHRHDIQLRKNHLQQMRDMDQRLRQSGVKIDLATQEQNEKSEAHWWEVIHNLEMGRGEPSTLNYAPQYIFPKDISSVKSFALREGLSATEVENLVEWKVREVNKMEQERLLAVLRVALGFGLPHKPASEERIEIFRAYSALMSYDVMVERLGEKCLDLPLEQRASHMQLAAKRLAWQINQMSEFIAYCFMICGYALQGQPLKVPTGRYEETLRLERTQADIINETAQELMSLPRFSAYAKLIEEQGGEQKTVKCKIQTRKLPESKEIKIGDFIVSNMQYVDTIAFTRYRDDIDAEIRERQRMWQRREPLSQKRLEEPPERPPPRDA